jgi:uncharacterized membrane protein YjgN (DUF898 family)
LSKEQRPTVAFVLSLISGIFTLIGGLTMIYVGTLRFGISRFDFMERAMTRYRYAFAAEPISFHPFVSLIGVLGIIFGVVVMASAVMLNRQPQQHQTWGIVILIFSILGVFGGMAGYLVGLVLGIVGGALAIAWKPSVTS